MSLLHTIQSHDQLVKLNEAQQEQLCDEIRQFLVDNVAKTGGHLASNLGVVELTVALETVFDTRKDRLVFDVGHQSYVHKLLTDRQADFTGLRQFGGMAGFPKPSESVTDAFVAGHASSSVSTALGMARARTLKQEDYHVVAVLGDGAATGGMVYEGINDTVESGEPLIIILNDNAMSIDRNVGGMARHLSRLRTKAGYLGMKRWFRKFTGKIWGGNFLYRSMRRFRNWLRRVLLPTTIFETMGLSYMGPVDGHDVDHLISVLQSAKEKRRPVLVHVITQKGKGYAHAEDDPSKFHGIGKFDPESGSSNATSGFTFSKAFGDAMCRLAKEEPRLCAITAAMPGGTGLLDFKKQFPNRLFDVGIAEEHAVSMAGGLAKQGMVPVVALYSTFLQRSFDQIVQDVSMLNLHVVFAIDRAGLVGEDGETHHGVFDVGFLSQIPGMTVLSPGNTAELEAMLRWAVLEQSGPVAIRYPRGCDTYTPESVWNSNMPLEHRKGSDCAIITAGALTANALMVRDLGMDVSVIRLCRVHPLPAEELKQALTGCRHAVILEDSCHGMSREIFAKLGFVCPMSCMDVSDTFVTHGEISQLHRAYSLDARAIYTHLQEVLKVEN